jgi:rhodanese-related sulfurtransferase
MAKFRMSPFIVLLVSACGLYGQDFDKMVDGLLNKTVPLIYPDSLFQLKKNSAELTILDAREREEYDVSHIEGAFWVGYDDFNLADLKISKHAEVVVYCSVGYRSEKIGEQLEEGGYDSVLNLYGGIFAWKNKGYPVVDNSRKETERVHAYSRSWGKWLIKGEKVYE